MTPVFKIYLNIFSMFLWIFSTNLVQHVHTEDCPRIINRTEWHSQVPLPADVLKPPVSTVFFHHTLTQKCNTIEICSYRMQNMQEYYEKELEYDDIGFNFVIGGDGNIYEGRGWKIVGAHTYGHNNGSISIAFIGDYSKEDPTSEMLKAAENLIECGVTKGFISCNYGLYGQRDGTCSLGPGKHFYDTLASKWPRWHANGEIKNKTCLA